ncbi:zinc ABC transporter substrate-binding protein [Bacillus shivajii]|uniref:metal ABC transporter solute-binding protein, Zn/Mn family n=1 Tax=Bacillus shivajii TaxID=1983719 RepID=UPI001CF9EC3A|nr:zinc ABC transporter substrate-binding protein [Bacillus shivajii]UCZ52604.1 zinc ABC transporter substrate-binding protein [Bacillus shivajii]
MKRFSIIFSSMLIASTFLAGCGQSEEEQVEESAGEETKEEVVEEIEELEIFTTLFPLEDFANRIGGEYVNVQNLVPVGADAHTFEPTANQMIDIADADLFIYNGAGFEGFADRIKETVDSHDVKVITAADGIDLIDYDHDHDHGHGHEEDDHDHDHGHGHEEDDHDHDHDHDHDNGHGHEEDDHDHDHDNGHGHEEDDHDHDHDNGHGHEEDDHDHDHDNGHGHEEDDHDHDHGHDHAHGDEDPHVWLDPIRAIELAENIKLALIELRPEAEEEFTTNFEELKGELEKLDEEFVEFSNEMTKDTIVVSHAGYGYWEDRYGIHQVGIAGISPTNEPSISQIQDIIAQMEENHIEYVMFEQNIPVSIAETVRDEVGAEALWIHNLESLTEEDVEAGEDYFSLMRSNIETLKTALQ